MASSQPEHRPLLVGESSDDETEQYLDSSRDDPTKGLSNGNQLVSPQEEKEENKVYKRRWYILILFSLFSCTFSTVWNCWGPISSSAEAVFHWSDSTIALLTNLGPMAYMSSGFLFPWFLQEKGLRKTVLTSIFIMGVGNTLRSLTSEPTHATVLIYIGQALNGLTGPIAMAAIPQVSSVWFPPDERVTATSVSNSFCIFGYGLAFLLGPAIVSEINMTDYNGSNSAYTDGNMTRLDYIGSHTALDTSFDMTEQSLSYNQSVDRARTEIMHYMYFECGWSWLLFLAMLIYFPAQPPLPPGRSAVAERDNYWSGLLSLRGKLGFQLVAFSYGISTGVSAGWAALLSVILREFDVDQDESGWIGFYSIAGACITSLLLCRFADYFIRRIKLFILLLYTGGSAALLVFALITAYVIPISRALLYFSVIVGFTLTNGAIPLLFELACELAYPTSESAANGFLTFLNNLACLVFLLVFSIPGVGTKWVNWTVMACTFICVPLIAMLKTRFNRLDLDEATITVRVDESRGINNMAADFDSNSYSINADI